MVRDKTLYDRLEINENSSAEEIKKSFFKLSKKWHPDKHQDENDKITATQKFKEINEAKEILLDAEKRGLYDQIGMDIFENGNSNQDDFNPFEQMFSQNFPFGMGNMGNRNRQQQQQEHEDIIEKLDVTLEQLYNEESIDFNYTYKSYCVKCNGEGYKDNHNPKCKTCDGKGIKVQVIRLGGMIQQSVVNCNVCNGTGKIIKDENKCEQCSGNCYLNKEKTIQIQLKSGLTTENKINFAGKGNNYKNNKSNLIILINELPHNIFKRNKDDLFIHIELKLYQALVGYNKIIKHLDGRLINLSYNSKTEFNSIKFIQDEGMKSLNNTKGNLYIKFSIKLPDLTNLAVESKTQIKQILESCEIEEVSNENKILTMENLHKPKLNLCKKERYNNLNNIFEKEINTSSDNHQHQQHHHHHHQQHQHHPHHQNQNVQCAQQ